MLHRNPLAGPRVRGKGTDQPYPGTGTLAVTGKTSGR